MFGRELTEQVRADSKISDRMVPLIVEKCIAAVDASGKSPPARMGQPINITNLFYAALDYEGIYRKTGGSGQSKLITQLFERGDYAAFDLHDTDRFNDICSTTSVLKSYLRSLPNPLLTFVLHDEFIFASSIQDPIHRSAKYADLVKQLPTEHYYTLRSLMLHLHRFVWPTLQYFLFFWQPSLMVAVFCLQDSRTPRAESDDGTQSRCRLWTYVSPLPPGLTFMYSRNDCRSNAYAFPQSRSRVQRHGWQGADHRMAGRKRANDFPTNADVVLLIIITSSRKVFPVFWILDLISYPHVFLPGCLCLHNVLLSHIPLFPPYTLTPLFFGLI